MRDVQLKVKSSCAWDRRTRTEKTTKSRRARRFNIEPALLPLLRQISELAGHHGTLVDLVSEPEMAVGLRRSLMHAGVTRHELHVGSAATNKKSWHDLRSTAARGPRSTATTR